MLRLLTHSFIENIKLSSKTCLLVIVACSVFLAGCNTVIDPPDPPVLSEIPDKVVKMFSARFPDATETTMRVVEKDKFWEADYRSGGYAFYVAMDIDSLLAWHGQEVTDLPDSVSALIPTSTIKDASFSGFGEILRTWYGNVEQEYRTKYVLDGKSYVMQWSISSKYGRNRSLVSYPYFKLVDPYVSELELPEKIRNFIKAEGLQIIEISTMIYIDENNRKRYDVGVRSPDSSSDAWSFFFDNEGELIFTNYKAVYKTPADLEGLPDGVKRYVQKMEDDNGLRLNSVYECFGNGRFVISMVKGYEETMDVLVDREGNFIEKPIHYIHFK